MIRIALNMQIAGATAGVSEVEDADSAIRLDKPLFNWTQTTTGKPSVRNR
jgi:hypothetical protein